MPRTPVQSGPVRRQLHLEDGIVEAGDIDIALADLARPFGRQLDDALAALRESSSSAAEHIMPFDTTPRTGFFSSVIFEPGMYVPSGANTPSMPARAFGAPQTTSISGWPLATSTCTTCSLSALGCLLGFDDARDRETRRALVAGSVDAFDLEADRRQTSSRSHRPSPWCRDDP